MKENEPQQLGCTDVVRRSSASGPPPLDSSGTQLFIGDRCLDNGGYEFLISSIGANPPGNVFEGHKGRKCTSVRKIE